MPLQGSSSLGINEIGVAVAVFTLLFGIYQFKASNLETTREREARLKILEGKSVKRGKFVIRVDNIELEAKSGPIYWFRRRLLRPLDGTIYVTVLLHDIGVPPEFWEMDHANAFYDTLDYDVECVNSEMTSQKAAFVFRLETSEYLDLKQFLDHLRNFFKVLEDTETISIADTRSGKFPF